MLTVWRMLDIEVGSMGGGTYSDVTLNIIIIRTNP
jgi:hypothetical protein